MPRSIHEVNCDRDILDLTKHGIQVAVSMGMRIVWNHKGMRGLLPSDVIEAELRLYHEVISRVRQYDKISYRIGKVVWDQTVPVPEAEPHDLGQTGTRS